MKVRSFAWVTTEIRSSSVSTVRHLCPDNAANAAASPPVTLPDPDWEGSGTWWAGLCRIKTLCLNEALVHICSTLHHRTCFLLSNFLSGEVRESWTGSEVKESQESLSPDWKFLLELHHSALFQHDLSPHWRRSCNPWSWSLWTNSSVWKERQFFSVLCIKVAWHFSLPKKERKKIHSEDDSLNTELTVCRQRPGKNTFTHIFLALILYFHSLQTTVRQFIWVKEQE